MMSKSYINRFVKRSMILNACKLSWFRKKWRKLNENNLTTAGNCFHAQSVEVGEGTYGELSVFHFGESDGKLKIGCYSSIAKNVNFLLGGEHIMSNLSTYPFKVKLLQAQNCEATSKGDIIVDDDVWIGYGATILSGVRIGQGAVVATGAVVTKDVPPYAIVGGVPAKIIKYRFSEEIIGKLLKIDFSKLTKEQIKEHIDDLYTPVTEDTNFDWLSKKDGEY